MTNLVSMDTDCTVSCWCTTSLHTVHILTLTRLLFVYNYPPPRHSYSNNKLTKYNNELLKNNELQIISILTTEPTVHVVSFHLTIFRCKEMHLFTPFEGKRLDNSR